MADENTGNSSDAPLASVKSENSRKTLGQRLRAYWLLIILSMMWGIAFVAIRRADYELSPVNLAILRWFISSIAYGIILIFLGRPKTSFEKGDLLRLLAISFANVPLYHLALNYAETTVSSGLAGLLISLGPVFITALSAYTLKEKISKNIVLALILAIVGALILAIGNLSSSSSNGLIGPIEVVVSAFAYALFSVLSKPLVRKYGPLHVAIWVGLIGTAMLVPLVSPTLIAQMQGLSMGGWFSVLYLALLSTVLGYSIFYTLLSRGAVSRLSIQLYLVPVVSVAGGVLFLKETVTLWTLLGGAIMLLAIALVTRPKT